MAEWDLNALLQAEFRHRESEVEVPGLADFVRDGKPAWKVRGLTSAEFFQAAEARSRDDQVERVAKAVASDQADPEAVCEALGITSLRDVPGEVRSRIEMMWLGTVEPALDSSHRDIVVKIAEHRFADFVRITNEIRRLTDEGSEIVGKSKGSGRTKASG